MKAKIDFGLLTEEETKGVLEVAISYLSEKNLFDVLDSVLTNDQKEELSYGWGFELKDED